MTAWREAAPPLIAITDATRVAEHLVVERLTALLERARPRTVVVQLRDRELPVRQRLALGERLLAQCRRNEQWLVVNDRMDIACLLGADGAHLGEGSVDTADARAAMPPGAWVSRACHDPNGAAVTGADAVLLSPVAAPRKGRQALGAVGVARARAAIDVLAGAERPLLYALGGVEASNVATWVAAGADGVAVVGAALDGEDPEALLVALGILRNGRPS